MIQSIQRLDAILRGEATRPDELAEGDFKLPIAGIALVNIALAMIYGLCMGTYAVVQSGGERWVQMLASAVKVPMLFGLTLLITLPSLYVFSVLAGSSLRLSSVVRLVLAMMGVTMAVLASLGPIVAFFGVSTTSYEFMKLLNVLMCSVAGLLGLGFLLRTLNRLVAAESYVGEVERGERSATPLAEQAPGTADAETAGRIDESTSGDPGLVEDEEGLDRAPAAEDPGNRAKSYVERRAASKTGELAADSDRPYTGALDGMDRPTDVRAARVYRAWIVLFAVVGAQMSWVL
ncbi:MAG: hypothetical protein AAFQ17_07195, partial [Pseudomonadota bacterium]